MVAVPGGGGPVDRVAQGDRAEQLHVLGVRPGKGHRRAAGTAGEQAAVGDRAGVPDLFGQHPAARRHPAHRLEVGSRIATCRQLVVAALADQERPATTDPGAVEGAPVLVLPVAVAAVAVPGGSAGRLGPEERVRDRERREDPRVVRHPQAEAHQGQEVRADHLVGRRHGRPGWLVAHRYERRDRGT